MQNSAARKLYYVDMAILGTIYLIVLFVCCFAAVHLVKLAYYGFLSLRKKPQPKEPPAREEPKQPKPVYYIVEKKRSRRTYSQPKEIEFK